MKFVIPRANPIIQTIRLLQLNKLAGETVITMIWGYLSKGS